MKNLFLLLAFLGVLVACGKKEYETVKGNAQELVGKKVTFDGSESPNIMQHMMSGPLSQQKDHFYIDPDPSTGMGQMVVYYSPEMIPGGQSLVGKKMRVYGVLGEVSGAGKGGGTHSELKLDLEKMEFLK